MPIIEVNNLGKKYSVGERQPYLALRDIFSNVAKSPIGWLKSKTVSKQEENEFWALRGINFSVERGEVLGVIGRNGAGKSTLLKVLSQITPPTTGEIILRGKVGSLLEVGTGFHPELTGRENIYLNGAVLGMRKKEIDRKFDEIVDFSGVERFLDMPVKRYSSGMYVRLAFAVAAHLDPDILIVDEVLAVGDIEFQKKCLGKMNDVTRQEGKTVLFVSHNIPAVESLCTKCLLLDKGSVVKIGNTQDVVSTYLHEQVGKNEAYFEFGKDDKKQAQIIKIKIANEAGTTTSQVYEQEDWTIEIDYRVKEQCEKTFLALSVLTAEGVVVYMTTDCDNEPALYNKNVGSYRTKLRIPAYFLGPSQYYLRFGLESPGYAVYDSVDNITVDILQNAEDIRSYYYQGKRFGFIGQRLAWNTQFIE